MSECIAGEDAGTVCRCKLGSFDSNGYSTAGGVCTSMNNLKATMLTFSSLTSNNVTIHWTHPPYSSQVSAYSVVWRVNGSSSIDGNLIVGNDVSTANITELTQGTEYVFSVVSVENGSRAAAQEIESDDNVTLTSKAELSEACGGSISCDDAMSECIAGEDAGTVCRCKLGSFDSNGYSTAGGVCTSMNNLKATMLTFSSLTSNNVTIHWTHPPYSSQVSAYSVVWRVNGSSSIDGNLIVGNDVSTANITELTQGTEYVFSVVSVENGSRAAAQEIESDDNVTLTSKAELSEACGGSISCDDAMSECIAGEDAGTVCRCKLGSFDSNGYSTAGGVCTSMNNLKATMLTFSSLTSNNVTIHWTHPPYSSQVSAYSVVWRVNGSSSIDGNLIVGNDVSTANITELTQGTEYVFSVVSVENGSRAAAQEIESDDNVTLTSKAELSEACGGSISCDDAMSECIAGEDAGTVCRCKLGSFDSNGYSTAGGVCTSMNNLKATMLTFSSLTSDNVTIHWTHPPYSSQVSAYSVVWRVNGSSSIDGNLIVGNDVSTANITELTQGTEYVFSVVSVENGSRAAAQEIESDDNVTLTSKAELSEACGGSISCDDAMSECIAGEDAGTVCRCKLGSFDSNGYSTAGGVCTSMNNLKATMLTFSSLTSNNVTIHWTHPPYSSQVSAYSVVWRVNGSSSIDGNLIVGNDVSTANITELTQGTEYVFSVVSVENGSRAAAQEIESDDNVTLTSKAELSEACGGSISCDDAMSECIAGEDAGTVCRCKLGSFDSNGYSTAGGVCTSMNNLKATMLTFSSLTSNNVTIHWTHPPYSSQVSAYSVVWRVNGSSSIDGNLIVGNDVSTANITELTQGTEYVFSVVSVENGSRAAAQEIESDDNVTLTSKAELSEACGGSISCDDAMSECIAGEDAGTVCRCKLGSFDSNGYSTAGGVCTSMNNLKATMLTFSSLTSNNVTIHWTHPPYSSQVSAYSVVWRVNGSSSIDGNLIVGNDVSTANITELTQGTEYVFSVVSVENGSRAAAQEIESDDNVTLTSKAELNEACGGSISCDDAMSECIAGEDAGTVCRCKLGSFDSNGYSTAGGVCTSMNNLKATMLTFSSLTSNNVTIHWTHPPYSSQVSAYSVVWRVNGSSSIDGNLIVGNDVSTANITELTQGTEYVFSVVSVENGSRAAAQEIESDDNVTLTSKAELSEACGGSISCDDAMSECIAGVDAGTVCRCKLGSFDSNGYSTAGGVCTSMNELIVRSFAVWVEGTSTVTIDWADPPQGNDQVKRYEIHWTPQLSNGTSNYVAGNITNARLTGFVSGQQYSFYIESVEHGSRFDEQGVQTDIRYITMDAGLSVACNTSSTVCADYNSNCTNTDDWMSTICRCLPGLFDSNGFNTPGGMCINMSMLAVTGLSLYPEEMNIVYISWTPPLEYTNQVNRYQVVWDPVKSINGSVSYNALQTTAVRLVGFTPGQTYTFSVYSVESGSRKCGTIYFFSTIHNNNGTAYAISFDRN
ncbi:uncharacterized protein LOC117327291 [Pecten maximus]|uniref:uncharacterized protein LOC117327291 n=1 Tax=Pecten maximus TaxID=6579 RepID=UPI0014588465|nr:uncharacterized protein LOC117327291 [Pecten maximus]